MNTFRGIADADVAGKRVLMRADLNVPLDGRKVRDATRIDRIVPTITNLLDRGAAVILISHLGRPKGEPDPALSLEPVAREVSARLGHPVTFVATDWRDGSAAEMSAGLMPGSVTLMENLRFHPGEEANDPAFVDALAAIGDIYVNDAFSAAHRAHASTEGVAHRLPAYTGFAMAAEIDALRAVLINPTRPVIAIVGGAKISTKIAILQNLLDTVDHLVIAGAMANTFFYAQRLDVGASLYEPDHTATARNILEAARKKSCHIVLPIDVVTAPALEAGAPAIVTKPDRVRAGQMILDAGPKTIEYVNRLIDGDATLLWNGPFGAFEVEPFDRATIEIARHAAGRTAEGKLVSIAGGGDTVAALAAADVIDQFTYVSTAGGAFLEWLEGKELPGIVALMQWPAGETFVAGSSVGHYLAG